MIPERLMIWRNVFEGDFALQTHVMENLHSWPNRGSCVPWLKSCIWLSLICIWGSSLPGLRTRDPPLSPPSTRAEIFKRMISRLHTWKIGPPSVLAEILLEYLNYSIDTAICLSSCMSQVLFKLRKKDFPSLCWGQAGDRKLHSGVQTDEHMHAFFHSYTTYNHICLLKISNKIDNELNWGGFSFRE